MGKSTINGHFIDIIDVHPGRTCGFRTGGPSSPSGDPSSWLLFIGPKDLEKLNLLNPTSWFTR